MQTTVINVQTRRIYTRKIRTTDAIAIFNVSDVQKAIIGEAHTQYLHALEKITIYIDPQTLQLSYSQKNSRIPVRLKVCRQWRGQRLYWICPQNGEKVTLLYLVRSPLGMELGSRKGLGLSYPSQSMHRTPSYDIAVLTGCAPISKPAFCRACYRRHKRQEKKLERVAKILFS